MGCRTPCAPSPEGAADRPARYAIVAKGADEPQSLTSILVHLIFSTKNREQLIVPDIKERLFTYMGAVWRETGGHPILINGHVDHVHVLGSLSSTRTMANAMRMLKSNSSKWVHDTFAGHGRFAWQSGYGAVSVSESNVEVVSKYIAGQEERHRTLTFQEEYRRFLERHGVPFDERYVWD